MKTVLYLIGHGATDAERFGRRRLHAPGSDPSLALLGIRQAEVTRDFLAVRPIDCCYCSPVARAVQTAAIVAAPHGLTPIPLEGLAERRHFADSHDSVFATMEELLTVHGGEAILVVGHHQSNRAYLAELLGLRPERAHQVVLDDCGISIVVREGTETTVSTLNAAFHLQGVAA